jgi:hypothetical protein
MIAVAQSPPKGQAEMLQNYRKWHLVTPKPVDMSPAIALSCAGPAAWNAVPNPHASRVFKVFVNSVGKDAMLSNGKESFPVGSIIIKEKFARPSGIKAWESHNLPANAKPELLTAMVKHAKGFDPANGDWEYVVLSGEMTKSTKVGLGFCADCHRNRKGTDFVFGQYGTIR